METGAADERRDFGRGEPRESLETEQAARLEHGDCLLHVAPGRVLGQNSANGCFKWGIAGPPVLRAERAEEPAIDALQRSGVG